jgi:hypothetical protein
LRASFFYRGFFCAGSCVVFHCKPATRTRQLTADLAATNENLARRQQFTFEDGERLTTEAGGFSYQTTRVVIGHRMLTDLAEKETEH